VIGSGAGALVAELGLFTCALAEVLPYGGQPIVYVFGTSALVVVAVTTLVPVAMLRGRALRLPDAPAWTRHVRSVIIAGLWGTAVAFVLT
jgi:hypothetical protein